MSDTKLTVTQLKRLQELSDTIAEWNHYEIQIRLLLKKQDDALNYDTSSK